MHRRCQKILYKIKPDLRRQRERDRERRVREILIDEENRP